MKAVAQNHQMKNQNDDKNLRMKPAQAQKSEYCSFEAAPVDLYLKMKEKDLVNLKTNFLYWLCQQQKALAEEDLQELLVLVQEPVENVNMPVRY